jgi:hypothetical protein
MRNKFPQTNQFLLTELVHPENQLKPQTNKQIWPSNGLGMIHEHLFMSVQNACQTQFMDEGALLHQRWTRHEHHPVNFDSLISFQSGKPHSQSRGYINGF